MAGLGGRWKARYRLTRRVSYYLWLLRRSEYWSLRGQVSYPSLVVSKLLNLRVMLLGERLGLDIPRHVFGFGLSIAHSGLLVANADANVGVRCRIHHGCTIAGSSDGSPTIGNDVFIGVNAVIVGNVRIGNGAYIYPGAIVTSDVPAGCSAAGIPARVMSRSHQPWRPSKTVSDHVEKLA
ncbi:serine acetyltransferase [Rhodococcoides fascians]|uniref:serine acetyltransferase n=1 Tax=Rhodococcoides fascians TaxID=1828 RepID=UPI003CF7C511